MCRKFKVLILLFLITIMTMLGNFDSTNAFSPESTTLYNGIDVSNWQRYVDYAKVKASGIEIVYIKASQGQRTKDPYFEVNYNQAKANGLKVGFYHYVNATNVADAQKEAEFFCSVISQKTPDCKLVMDYEQFNGIGKDEINKIAETFLTRVKQITGKEVIVYSNLYNSKNIFDETISNKYSLWLAYYASETSLQRATSNWNNWIGWQYTNEGIINGINGYVDRDKFTQAILLNDTSNLPDAGGNTDNGTTNTIYYTVKRGDTLWQIAKNYGTTVNIIARDNNIQNPNLIYPGQIFKIITNKQSTSGNYMVYTVRRGDTLWGISQKYGVTVSYLVNKNGIKNPNLIYPGQLIKI